MSTTISITSSDPKVAKEFRDEFQKVAEFFGGSLKLSNSEDWDMKPWQVEHGGFGLWTINDQDLAPLSISVFIRNAIDFADIESEDRKFNYLIHQVNQINPEGAGFIQELRGRKWIP